MPKYKFAAGGKTFEIESPTALSDQDMAYISSKTFGAAAPAKQAEKPTPEPGDDIYGNALADLFGISGRPGAVPLTGRHGFETPAGVWAKPGQNVTDPVLKGAEHLASQAIDVAPLTKAATIPKMMLTAGALGGAKAEARGEGAGASFGDALVDAAITGLTGGAGKLATTVGREKWGVPSLQALARRVAGFEHGTEQIKQSARAVAGRLPSDTKPWLSVPELGKGLMTYKEAIDKLLASGGQKFDIARKELVAALNQVGAKLEKAGVKPRQALGAGRRFDIGLPEFRRAPTGRERFADVATSALTHPVTRAAGSAVTTGEAAGSEQALGEAGAGAIGTAAGSFGEVARAARRLMP